MSIYIKQIDDKDFLDLSYLYNEYNKKVTNLNNYQSGKDLVDTLAKPGAYALGLYSNEDKLVGFMIGYREGETSTFNWASLYIEPKYRYYTKTFIKAIEDCLRTLNYTSWLASSHTKEGIRLIKHYGAEVVEIKYYKEL